MGVLIGTMSLGQAMPNLEYISNARGAAAAVWEIIDLVHFGRHPCSLILCRVPFQMSLK